MDGRPIAPLDILQMRLARTLLETKYQRENREVLDWEWEIVGQADPEDLLPYCTKSSQILHNGHKVVEPSLLERLPPDRWQSLELVRVPRLRFIRVENRGSPWQALFTNGRLGIPYQLPVTDPVAVERLNNGGKCGKEFILAVSIDGAD